VLNDVKHPDYVKIDTEWGAKHVGLKKRTLGAFPGVLKASEKQVHPHDVSGATDTCQHSQDITGPTSDFEDAKACGERMGRAAQRRFYHPVARGEPKMMILGREQFTEKRSVAGIRRLRDGCITGRCYLHGETRRRSSRTHAAPAATNSRRGRI
jgi:hypothetical protein